MTAIFLYNDELQFRKPREHKSNLEIATDMAEQWNVTDSSNDKYQHRASKDDDGTECRHRQKRSRQGTVDKISADVVPRTGDIALGQKNGIKSEGVDRLTRSF